MEDLCKYIYIIIYVMKLVSLVCYMDLSSTALLVNTGGYIGI